MILAVIGSKIMIITDLFRLQSGRFRGSDCPIAIHMYGHVIVRSVEGYTAELLSLTCQRREVVGKEK